MALHVNHFNFYYAPSLLRRYIRIVLNEVNRLTADLPKEPTSPGTPSYASMKIRDISPFPGTLKRNISKPFSLSHLRTLSLCPLPTKEIRLPLSTLDILCVCFTHSRAFHNQFYDIVFHLDQNANDSFFCATPSLPVFAAVILLLLPRSVVLPTLHKHNLICMNRTLYFAIDKYCEVFCGKGDIVEIPVSSVSALLFRS